MRCFRLFNWRYVFALVLALSSCVYVSAGYISADSEFFEEGGVYYRSVGNGCVEVVVGVTTNRNWTLTYHYTTGDVVIPPRLASGAKVIGIGFDALNRATSVSLPVTIQYFEECAFGNGISEIVIPKYVERIEPGVFARCSNLRKIEVDPANTMFDSREGCNAIIRTADNILIAGCRNTMIPNSIVGIERSAFNGQLLGKLVIPDSVAYIGSWAFSHCAGLVEVVLPENLDSIGDFAFSGCTGLTGIKLPETLTSLGEGVFSDCTSLPSIKLPETMTSLGEGVFSGCAGLTSVKLPETLTSLGESVFDGCTSLTDIELPKALSHIGDYAFRGCTSLTDIEFPKTLNFIGIQAFSGCSGLKSVVLHEGVALIKNKTFYGCSALTSVTLPDGLIEIRDYAFYNCKSLRDLSLPPSLTSIGEKAFGCCNELASVNFADVGDAKEGSVHIGDNAFVDCVSLKEVHLSKCVDHIGELVFEGCNNLKRIVVEEGNKNYDSRDNCNAVIRTLEEVDPTSGDTIRQDEVFIGCKGTVIPKSVSVIGAYAFGGDFTNIAIPEWITEIKSDAFVRCRKVTTVYSHSITPPMVYIKPGGLGSFYNSSAAKLFVPVGSKLSYSNPMVDWCLFGDIVEWSKITPMPGSDGVVVYDTSAIDEIEIDDVLGEDGEAAEYYNLQGVKVANPANGVFIKKQGGKTTKVVL